MMNASKKVLQKITNSLKYSFDGIKIVWKKELSFRLEIYASFIALPLAVYLPTLKIYSLLLILLLMLLLTTEIINSAIEAIVDRISTDNHPLSKIAKDLGCAAVTMVVLMNIIAWLVILF